MDRGGYFKSTEKGAEHGWIEGQASGEELGRPPCHVRDKSRRRIEWKTIHGAWYGIMIALPRCCHYRHNSFISGRTVDFHGCVFVKDGFYPRYN